MKDEERCACGKPSCETHDVVEVHALTFGGLVLAVVTGVALYNIVYLIVDAIVGSFIG